MAKETRKQIIENTRKKYCAKYTKELKELQVTNAQYYARIRTLVNKVTDLECEKSALEIKIKEQEDWIERLVTFVNMPPDERERELATMRQQQANAEAEEKLFNSPLFKMYEKYLGQLFM